MANKYEFDAPRSLHTLDTSADSYFDEKEEMERSLLKGTKQSSQVSSTTHTKRGSRVTFSEEDKENVDQHSILRRLATPKPKIKEEEEDQEAENEDFLERIEKLTIDSSKKSPRRQKTPQKVFEGIKLLPSSEKKHRMKTRGDVLIRTPRLDLRNRSILRAIESPSTEDTDDESMVSAVSSTSAAVTCNVSKTENAVQRDFGSFIVDRRESHRSSTNYSNFKRKFSQHFSCDVKSDQPQKFVALAEQTAKFWLATPDRFRSKPLPRPAPMIKHTLGIPRAPALKAASRTRPNYYLGQKHKEEQEYEEMLKHQVKARPLNEKILHEVSLGLKAPVPTRPKTVVEPFHLTETKPKSVVKNEVFVFTAKPVPKKILEQPVGIPMRKTKPPTSPKTPAIKKVQRVKASPALSKAGSIHSSTDSLLRKTQVVPFSFDERDKNMLARKEENIEKVKEEEKKTFSMFRANPVRKFTFTVPQPLAEPKKTVVVPFNLTETKKHVQIKEEPDQEVKEFKAQPASVLKKAPFVPKLEPPPKPKVLPFHLKTEERICERKKFEEQLIQKQEEIEKLNQKAREEEEKRKEEEAKQLRKLAEFKAHPVPKVKPFKLKETLIPLTDPMTPPFLSKKKK